MSSASRQMELQHPDSIVESLLERQSISNIYDDSYLDVSNISASNKQFQNKAKLQMEARAEEEQQQSYQFILQKLTILYNESLEGIQKQINVLYQLPIIKPKQMIFWKPLINLLTLFVCFEIPVYIAFGDGFWKELNSDGKIAALYYTISLLLVIDMGLDFVTAYYKHGNLVTDNKQIALHYFYGNFVFDLIAITISIARLSLFIDDYRFVFLMFYFKLPSMLMFDMQLSEMLLLHKKTRLVYEVGKKIVFMLFCFNVFCSVFYMLGVYSVSSNYDSWLTTAGNFGIIMDRPMHQIYFFSFYFSLGTVSTTMGYGDITPMNVIECSWSLLGVMFAIMVFANNINYFQKMMEEFHLNDFKQYKYKISINKFMEQKQVPSDLQERIRQYLNELWYQQGTRDYEQEQLVFQMLAPELKQELFYQSYGQFLQTTFFAKHFSKNLLKELSEKIKEVNYSTGDMVIEAGDQYDDQAYYFIQSGTIVIKSGNCDIIKKKLTAGYGFGEYSFITGQARTATAYSKEYSQLHKISRQDFLEVLNKFPDDYEVYCKLRDSLIFLKSFDQIGENCWTCQKFDHYAHQCPFTHYLPQAQYVIENDTILDEKQKRIKLQRYDRKHWPTLKNQRILVNGLDKAKLQKYATVMLKTVRSQKKKMTLPPNQQQSYSIEDESPKKVTFIKSDSIMDESIKISNFEENEKDTQQKQEQNEQSGIFNLQNKLNKIKDDTQYQIHQGLDLFDEPSNFKFYFKKGNYSNYKAFQSIKESQLKKQINFRKSFMPGAFK